MHTVHTVFNIFQLSLLLVCSIILTLIFSTNNHLPKNSATIPTEKDDNMPPMEKMATESDHRDVSVCGGIGSEYLSIHVELYSCSMIWDESKMMRHYDSK